MGVSAEDAATAAANRALKAAGEVGSTAVETVRKAVAKPINGVKILLKEPDLALSKNPIAQHATLLRRPRQLRNAIELAIIGYHFRRVASRL